MVVTTVTKTINAVILADQARSVDTIRDMAGSARLDANRDVLIKFNLASIPKGVKVTRAVFCFYGKRENSVAARAVALYPIQGAWNIGDKVQPALGAPITGDATSGLSGTSYGWSPSINVQSVVQAYVDGVQEFHGFEFNYLSSDGYNFNFYDFLNRKAYLEIEFEDNTAPTVALDAPVANATLHENDTLNIAGTADDTNIGDVVTVRYQVNAQTPVAILPFVADGSPKSFSRQLTFKGGNLYDGNTLIASNLADGVSHALKVYVTDDKGGQSAIIERTFYVVPNRAPQLTVNAPVIEGLIDSDTFTISGIYGDQDGNDVTVAYRINGGNSVQVASGTSGNYDFTVKFGQLVVGTNAITVEATDSYGAKTSKTVRLNKSEVKADVLKSTARYRLHPPTGTASELLAWVQHGAQLAVSASVSMTDDGEAESFVAMNLTNTSPLDTGAVEDEFYYDAGAAKSRIILQLDLERDSVDVDDAITLISGVF